jgi:hypothetical protein
MTAGREKKSETLEVRLPHGLKTRFMARCRTEGVTASEAVRGFIESRARLRPARLRAWRVVVAGVLAGLALGAVAAPSIAEVVAPGRATFERLDVDGDGALSFEEFRAR